MTGAVPPQRVADGWPGIVGIVMLLGGLFALHQTPAMTPAGGYLGGEFMYADPRGPETSIPVAGARQVADATATAFRELGEAAFMDTYWATIVAIFEDETDASSAASVVDVPDGASLVQHGPILILMPIEHDPESPPDPRIAQLSGLGARVLVEGDRFGEGSIVVDLSCTAASEEDAGIIATAVGDYGAAPYYAYARPPWVGPPITVDEALARSTFRLWTSSFVDSMSVDGALAEYANRFLAATSPEERERLMAEMGEHIASQQLEGLDGEEVHPGVVALLAASPTGGDSDDTTEWGLQIGRFMGPLLPEEPEREPTWFEQREGASIGAVQAVGSTVKLGWTSFNRIAIGLPALIGYLGEHGCDDVQVRLSDFDDVRGD